MAKIDWKYTEGTVSNIMEMGGYGRDNYYAITFVYKVDDHFYGGEFNAATVHSYSEGGKINVGYNPANPEENNLNHEGGWLWWFHLAYIAAFVGVFIYMIRGCHK